MKDIKDYIHLYPFCEAITDSGITGKIVRLSFDYQLCIIQFNDLGQTVSKPYADIKLLLRPLSDMTDVEKQDLGFGHIPHAKSADQRFQHYHGWDQGKYTPKQFIYLLSKGFDLFGLIEAGLAIDKTKVPA